MNILEIEALSKYYDTTAVLRQIHLSAKKGDVTALLGPSGCGKTTLLRIIAGLEQADTGCIRFNGAIIDAIPTHERGFGMMFQDYALFPHRNVAENIAFGPQMQHWSRTEIVERVREMVTLIRLEGYERRRVYELSGGERQRVALARALAPRPRLLMLDEPLAALDRTLREQLQGELHTILRHVGVTSLYVTHDQQEAFALADQVILLNAGAVVQKGTPEMVYSRPSNIWAAHFLGLTNSISGIYNGAGIIQTPLGNMVFNPTTPMSPQSTLTLIIYPDAALHFATAPQETPNRIRGFIVAQQFRGRFYRVTFRHACGIELSFELEVSPGLIGAEIELALRTDRMHILAGESSP